MNSTITNGRNAVSAFTEGVRDRWAGAPGWQRWTVYVLVFIGALLLPAESVGRVMSPYSDWASVLFFPIGTFIVLAIGLNVVVGQAGLLDLGYVAFFAMGGYSMALLGTKLGLNFWEIMVVGVLLSAVSGVILGGPTLRLRGDYLAIVTLGFGEIVRQTAENTDFIGGPRGIAGIPHPPSVDGVVIFGVDVFHYGVLDPRPYYYLLVVVATAIIIFVKRWEKSRVGRAWAAIREDEDAAEVMGVPTFKFKLLAFAIGASIGGAMGVVWAGKTISINPNDFMFMLSATILAAVVLGGSGNVPGVILGAFLVAWLPERFRGLSEYRIMVFGAALVALMIFRPEGLLPSRRRKAELEEGTGGMGSLGAEVAGPDSHAAEGAAK
ncbi:branched-chain amino acid ABC transporter permease [Sphaerisporangium rubeum]|uniref:Branched-chain amino acid transport system permease protein n=1 Tax=Sphaerisporangium rubeum TaxID=321317 RepID=A0A7X0IFV3_9ACTN|nr:branched-chain amino acid ABC transporter permease [Sphaerisporangium rubeum]MBB6474461.1 branched-chain amino acid transport system permease protein [Sphaerisporangium rubeum]